MVLGRNGSQLDQSKANCFQVLAFSTPKWARADREFFLSRIQWILFFLSMFENYFVTKSRYCCANFIKKFQNPCDT